MLLFTLQKHLGQWTARDCARLKNTMHRRLTAPEPLGNVLENDKRIRHEEVDHAIDVALDGGAAGSAEGSVAALAGLSPAERAILKSWSADPAARAALHAEAGRQIDALYQQALTMLRDPGQATYTAAPPSATDNANVVPIARVFVLGPEEEGSSAAAYLFWACKSHAVDGAYQRLFYVTVALQSWRWDHGSYPATLTELNLGTEANDPFTGQPFLYQRGQRGKSSEAGKVAPIIPADLYTFTLASAGPPEAGGGTKVKRVLLKLTGLPYYPVP